MLLAITDRSLSPFGFTRRIEKSGFLLADITLCLDLDDLFFQGHDLGQVELHLPVSRRRRGRCCRQFPHPSPQHALRHAEAARCLRHRHTLIRHKPDGFNL
jgi:hypothetical protein